MHVQFFLSGITTHARTKKNAYSAGVYAPLPWPTYFATLWAMGFSFRILATTECYTCHYVFRPATESSTNNPSTVHVVQQRACSGEGETNHASGRVLPLSRSDLDGPSGRVVHPDAVLDCCPIRRRLVPTLTAWTCCLTVESSSSMCLALFATSYPSWRLTPTP